MSVNKKTQEAGVFGPVGKPKKHRCRFTALHAPHGEGHAHQCFACDDVVLVGAGPKCDGNPKTHTRVS